MRYRLEELFDLQMGKTPARANLDYWNGCNKWVSISDLSGYDKYVTDTKECISDLGVSESGIKAVPNNTVIMSFKLSIGKTAITTEEVYTNEAIMAFIDKGVCEIDADYLYYLFSGMDWNKGTNKAVLGLTLNKATLSKKEVDIPDLHTQNEVVKKLDSLSNVIQLQKQSLDKLDELIKSRFVEMFGDPVSNPMKWHKQPLNELTTKIGSGATPRGGRDSYCSDGISLIRSMNVHNGFFEYKDLAHVSDEQATKLSNVTIQNKDVLLNITGASVARCCVVPDDILPARVNQHVCIIRCNDYVIPMFVCKAFTSNSFQNYLLEIAGSGATREAITKQQIESITMIVPPLSLQNQFVDFVTQVEKQKATVQQSIDKLETLKKSLMQEYFG